MNCRISGLSAAALLAGCVAVNPAGAQWAVVKPASVESDGKAFFHISYSGHWERVERRFDGRLDGQSMRSFRALDSMTVLFRGTRLRIHGVTGPQGGSGIVVPVGFPSRSISFYSPTKRPHALVYESPLLSNGIHSASVVVAPRTVTFPHRRYVNIDQIEVK